MNRNDNGFKILVNLLVRDLKFIKFLRHLYLKVVRMYCFHRDFKSKILVIAVIREIRNVSSKIRVFLLFQMICSIIIYHLTVITNYSKLSRSNKFALAIGHSLPTSL